MGSNLDQIYADIAGKSVTITAVTPNQTPEVHYQATTMRNIYEQLLLPVRVLLPWQDRSGNNRFGFLGLGTPATVTWMVCDLLLYRRAEQGLGIADIVPVLRNYVSAYADVARTYRNGGLASGTATLKDLEFEMGVYEYPMRSGNEYHGAACIYTVMEYLTT